MYLDKTNYSGDETIKGFFFIYMPIMHNKSMLVPLFINEIAKHNNNLNRFLFSNKNFETF